MSGPEAGGGLLASLRGMLANAVELAQVRLQLLGTELELAANSIFDGLVRAAAALVLLALGLVLLCGFILLVVQDSYRLAATGLLALLLLGAGAWLLMQARKRLDGAAGIFRQSLAELRRDRDALAPRGLDEQG